MNDEITLYDALISCEYDERYEVITLVLFNENDFTTKSITDSKENIDKMFSYYFCKRAIVKYQYVGFIFAVVEYKPE